jgi:hypothetical protein
MLFFTSTTNQVIQNRQDLLSTNPRLLIDVSKSGEAGPDLTHLDRTPLSGWALGSDGNRLGLGFAIQQKETAHHFFGLCKRPIQQLRPATPHLYAGSRGVGRERLGGEQQALGFEPVSELHHAVIHRLPLGFGAGVTLVRVFNDEQGVRHGVPFKPNSDLGKSTI